MENNTINFVMGGKLGDLIQSLITVKGICNKSNKKANLYIFDIGWEFGINNVYKELYPIIIQQLYINSFKILTDYKLDAIQTPTQNSPIQIFNKNLIEEGYIDLGIYIRSPFLYKCCWSELYSKTFEFEIPSEINWLTYNQINDKLTDKVLIHRKHGNRINKNSFNLIILPLYYVFIEVIQYQLLVNKLTLLLLLVNYIIYNQQTLDQYFYLSKMQDNQYHQLQLYDL